MREREKRISLDAFRPSKGTFPGDTWEDGREWGTIVQEGGKEGTER